LANDEVIGAGILVASLLGTVVYGLLLFYFWEIAIQVTAFVMVAGILGILAWIGYTMATTPPPEPITETPEIKTEQGIESTELKK
jgi:predicted DNA-binding transcriptional regulator